jgi:hypothetical protein
VVLRLGLGFQGRGGSLFVGRRAILACGLGERRSPGISGPSGARGRRKEGEGADAWDRAVRERVKGAERAGGTAPTSGPRRSAEGREGKGAWAEGELGRGAAHAGRGKELGLGGSFGPGRKRGRESPRGKREGRGVWAGWLGWFLFFPFSSLFFSKLKLFKQIYLNSNKI